MFSGMGWIALSDSTYTSCWSIAALRVQSNVLHVTEQMQQEKHIPPNKMALAEVCKSNAQSKQQNITGYNL